MKKSIIVAFMLIISLACQTSYSFGFSSCTFQVLYTDNECLNFTFQRCIWDECTLAGEQRHPFRNCFPYERRTSNDWNFCTGHCCHSDIQYPLIEGTIANCQGKINSFFYSNLTATISIIGGVIIVTTCLFIFFCRRYHEWCPITCKNCMDSCKNCFSCLRKKESLYQTSEQHNQKVNVEISGAVISLQEHHDDFHPVWRYESIRDEGNTCPICFHQKSSIKLHCGHYFHRQCIMKQVKTNQGCCLCKSTNFNESHIYCQTCFNNYFEASLIQRFISLEHKQTCSNCSQQKLGA